MKVGLQSQEGIQVLYEQNPQQLMEMHHAGGIGVAEAHAPLELEPVVGGGHGLWKSRRQDEAGNPSMPSNP